MKVYLELPEMPRSCIYNEVVDEDTIRVKTCPLVSYCGLAYTRDYTKSRRPDCPLKTKEELS